MDYYLGILAGGRSNRFGSNKAVFRIDGTALISRFLLESPKLNPLPKEIFISLYDESQFSEIIEAIQSDITLTQKSKYIFSIKNNGKNDISVSFLFDSLSLGKDQRRAAIIGFQTVFNHISNGFVQILPCDTPYFGSKIMNYILSISRKDQWKWDAIVPRWKNGYIEPLNSLYNVGKFKKIIQENIIKNDLRISHLFNKSKNVYFLNIEEELKNLDPTIISFNNFNKKEFLKNS